VVTVRCEGGEGNRGVGDNCTKGPHNDQEEEEQGESGRRDTILCALRKRTVVQYTPCPIVRPMNMTCQDAVGHATAALCIIKDTNNQ